MRKLLPVLALVALAGFTPDPTGLKTFDNCSASGSAAQTLTADRTYLLKVFDEEVFICHAATGSTCASGGMRYGSGFAGKVHITADLKSVSCRSTGATGDADFTPVE